MPNVLSFDFPRTVTIKLQQGTHNGRLQFFAPYQHGGKHCKLVVMSECLAMKQCAHNETWEVSPLSSPNGHIVFCRLNRKVLSATGVHPVFSLFPRYRDEELEVELKKCQHRSYDHAGASWSKRGLLSEVRIKDGVMSVTLGDAVSIPTAEYEDITGPAKEHFDIPLDGSIWHETRNEPSMLTWQEGNADYQLTFYSHRYFPEDYFSDRERFYDFDEGAYEAYRERREELYWERLEGNDY
jgi:hypothetical protein